MDKVIQRTRMAERQVQRRLKEMSRIRYVAGFKRKRFQQRSMQLAEVSQQRKAAVAARHEDWELGPLAPRRDVARVEPDALPWGAISPPRADLDTSFTEEEKEAMCAWAGGKRYLCLRPGDRVVVLEGPYKGKIGEISEVKKELGGVRLSFVQTNVQIPDYMRGAVPDLDAKTSVVTMPTTVPVSAVRLVHPLAREDGVVRDVIVRELRPVMIVHDRVTRTVTWRRVVPGLNVLVPWPKHEAAAKKEDHAADTLRIDVEERTFVPTLLRPPVPAQLIDELRNRYSRFRTRHTDEYIAAKEAAAQAGEARRRSVESMRTPLQEFNMRQREARRARGQPVLTDEMLDKIGQVIASNRHRLAARKTTELQRAIEQLSLADPPFPNEGSAATTANTILEAAQDSAKEGQQPQPPSQ